MRRAYLIAETRPRIEITLADSSGGRMESSRASPVWGGPRSDSAALLGVLVAMLTAYIGCPPLMEGRFGEARFAYMDIGGPLKTVLELVHRPEGFVRPNPDYWYPEAPHAD